MTELKIKTLSMRLAEQEEQLAEKDEQLAEQKQQLAAYKTELADKEAIVSQIHIVKQQPLSFIPYTLCKGDKFTSSLSGSQPGTA